MDYTIESITVTMNGEDITSNCVSNNNISIESVTGNIIITVKCYKESVIFSLDNLIQNVTMRGNATLDKTTNTFTMTAKNQSLAKGGLSISVAQNEKIYAKWDNCEVSDSNTIANGIGIIMSLAGATSTVKVADYQDYSNEVLLLNRDTGEIISSPQALTQIVSLSVKTSSSYTGTLPVSIKIDNFRIYKKVY